MARLPNDQIEHIKQDISLLTLVESQGCTVHKQGKDHAVACPFHNDDTPSLIISPKTNLYHCFGCGAAGSVIDWVMHTDKLSFRQAADKLRAQFFPLAAKEPKQNVDTGVVVEKDQTVLLRVINFYHETLKQSPEALTYLKSRGLDDPALIDTFKLGYANRTLSSLFTDKSTDTRKQLQQLGMYRDSGHEHFNGSLVVPIINEQGDIAEVYGRKLLNNLRKGTPKHLYLPGPHQGVFNPACLHSEEIILCESLIDALTFWRHGFRNVTTSYGTQGFTAELLEAFISHSVKTVYIAYDNDEAGQRAADLLAEQLKEKFACFRVVFPSGMDANEYALKTNPADKSLGVLIEQAHWLGQGDDPRQKNPVPVATVPASTDKNIDVELIDNEIRIPLGKRSYRIRGLDKATNYQQLKINLCASCEDNLHIDQLDLYNAKARYHFVKQAAIELGCTEEVIKKDVSRVLLKLEALQVEQINGKTSPEEKAVELNRDEEEAALNLLRDPSLLSRLLDDFDTCGVVGENTNKLMGYLAAVSRKLDNPLAVIVQSTSAAGKSALMNAVLAMMPEEEKVQYSAMTGQSLFYMGETNLKHKILAIAEEEGAENASYALKLLQSEGELTIASTGKDADGNLTTQEHHVEGPVMLFSTTTAIDIDEELMNRCIVLTVNESREQTRHIHELQRERETLEGLIADEERKGILNLHRNAQRLLKPLKVVNPFARQLTFMDNQTRSRRDHMKYLRLIKTVALLHQYQRKIKTLTHKGKTLDYIEVEINDIAVANDLAHEVLGRSLNELPPQTQGLLDKITGMVKRDCYQEKSAQEDYRFSRKQVRDESGWSDFQIKKHMQRLEELEYVLIHSGGRGKSIVYELLYQGEGKQGDLFLMGLIDAKTLQYDCQKEPLKQQKEPSSRPQSALKLPPGSTGEKIKKTLNKGLENDFPKINGNHRTLVKSKEASHHSRTIGTL